MPDPADTPLPPVIGKTSATERDANSSDKFNFWLAPGTIANPFDIVGTEQRTAIRQHAVMRDMLRGLGTGD